MYDSVFQAICSFAFEGVFESYIPYGNGHINDTYAVTFTRQAGSARYILQRVNQQVFKKPEAVMENIAGVTRHLKEKIIAAGGDFSREALNIIPTKDHRNFYIDESGNYWRGFTFIDNATTYELVERPEDFYQSALAFGNFQMMLADYPAATLHETIPNFHHTPLRMRRFREAAQADVKNRAKGVHSEIQFVLDREEEASILTDALERGEIPLRVTHNDTKLNNVMIDDRTHKAICIIDLDTVMPGSSLYDFGDSIRFGAATAEEDEKDLSKQEMSLSLYEIFTRGFLESTKGTLTDKEIELLPYGAKLMTFECGVRFLTDYLEGDTYFKIRRQDHNLDRARTQLHLVSDMEKKWEDMRRIVEYLA